MREFFIGLFITAGGYASMMAICKVIAYTAA